MLTELFGGFLFDLLYLVPAVVISLTIHEFSHAWVAVKLGDPTPRYDKRLSLNPLNHIDIIGFKPIEKGLSGGISVLGTVLALVSSFVLMLMPFALRIINMSVWCYVLASIVAFIGALIDSVLGSLFQALYQCEKCGEKIETDTHCGEKAKLIKGFPKIKNITVNFLTSLLTFALGFVLVFVL